jgi:hypothetical protein
MTAAQFKKYLRENGLGFGINAKGATVSPDDMSFKKADDPETLILRVRRSYFYSPSQYLCDWAQSVKEAVEAVGAVDVKIVKMDDQFKAWPKTSYREVTLTIGTMPVKAPK